MFENEKCCVGLKRDGGWVIPHDPDGWTDSVQCDKPVVWMEQYADFEDATLPVCVKHRALVQLLYEDFMASEARRQRFTSE